MSDNASTATRPSLRNPRHWPTFAFILAAFVIARLPWGLQRALGRGVGTVAYHVASSRRRAAPAGASSGSASERMSHSTH